MAFADSNQHQQLLDLRAENTALREQLTQAQGERDWFKVQCSNLQEGVRTEAARGNELQSQLAQAEKERDNLRYQLQGERALDLLTDRHVKKELSDTTEKAMERNQ